MTLEELGSKTHEVLMTLSLYKTNASTLLHIYQTDKAIFTHLANEFLEALYEQVQYLQQQLDAIAYPLSNFELPEFQAIFDNYINNSMKEQPKNKAVDDAFKGAKGAEGTLLKHVPFNVFEAYDTANAHYNALVEAHAYTNGFMKGVEYVTNGGKAV